VIKFCNIQVYVANKKALFTMMNKPFTASNYFVAQNNRNNDNTNCIVSIFAPR